MAQQKASVLKDPTKDIHITIKWSYKSFDIQRYNKDFVIQRPNTELRHLKAKQVFDIQKHSERLRRLMSEQKTFSDPTKNIRIQSFSKSLQHSMTRQKAATFKILTIGIGIQRPKNDFDSRCIF